MNKFVKKACAGLKSIVRKSVDFVDRQKVKLPVAGAALVGAGQSAMAQTDATVIATNAETAFGTIAPITITIAGFYVILRIAKKVVH